MAHEPQFHIPVLVPEVLDLLDPKPGQTVVDGTLGGGGHAAAIAERIAPDGRLVGIDLDPQALAAAKETFAAGSALPAGQINFVHGGYAQITEILDGLGIGPVDGILVDLGISSYDLDESKRGFSFQKDEPLDMRFNPESKPTSKHKEIFNAAYIVNHYEEAELENAFRVYGEDRFSKKIARGIVATRQDHDIATTTELFNIIKRALPAPLRFKAADNARRIFQALRIETNRELRGLEEFLPAAFARLKPGGRLAVISFHSLEDRIVKKYFVERAKGCICPPDFPECRCGRNPEGKILTRKPVTASDQEAAENPRSKPAKLRAIQKIISNNQ